jgi:hypothetical protein
MEPQMIGVLYYGRTCTHSQDLLRMVAKQGIADKLRFVPVDRRIKRGDQLMAILDNGSQVLIPNGVNAVPALLDIRDKNVYTGPQVGQRLAAEAERAMRAATGAEREPMAFSDISTGDSSTFSFVGDDPTSLLARGSGGTAVPTQFAGATENISISAGIKSLEPEDVSGGKVTTADFDAFMAQREAAVPMQAISGPPPGAGLPPPQKV